MKPKKDRIFLKINFFKNKDIKVSSLRDYTEYSFINRDTFKRERWNYSFLKFMKVTYMKYISYKVFFFIKLPWLFLHSITSNEFKVELIPRKFSKKPLRKREKSKMKKKNQGSKVLILEGNSLFFLIKNLCGKIN